MVVVAAASPVDQQMAVAEQRWLDGSSVLGVVRDGNSCDVAATAAG